MLNATDLGALMIVLVNPLAAGAGAAAVQATGWVVSLCVAGGLLLGVLGAFVSTKVGYWILRHQFKVGISSAIVYVLWLCAFLLGGFFGVFSLAERMARSVAA